MHQLQPVHHVQHFAPCACGIPPPRWHCSSSFLHARPAGRTSVQAASQNTTTEQPRKSIDEDDYVSTSGDRVSTSLPEYDARQEPQDTGTRPVLPIINLDGITLDTTPLSTPIPPPHAADYPPLLGGSFSSFDAYLEQESSGFPQMPPLPPPPQPPPSITSSDTTQLTDLSSPPSLEKPFEYQLPSNSYSSFTASAASYLSLSSTDVDDEQPQRQRPPAFGSVSLDDTSELLTDVEALSPAPTKDWLTYSHDNVLIFAYSVLIGGVVATSVFMFDVLIQTVHDAPDTAAQLGVGGGRAMGFVFGPVGPVPFRCIMPIGAGFAVAWLSHLGFSPPLKSLVRAIEGVVDDPTHAALPKSYWQVIRKAVASAVTLGSGASLGPEAPSVELGANTAAVIMPQHLTKKLKRMLIAGGAAAGVAAAFDAPVTGALFATEFVLKSSRLGLDRLSVATVFVSTSVSAGVVGFLRTQGQALGISGAGTHLVGRIPYFSVQPHLLFDVLEFCALGVACSAVATGLYEGVRICEVALRPFPRWVSAPIAGAICGVIAYEWPQVQYGYVNLEEVFRSSESPVLALLALLLAKIVATSVCVGGGLVGGLFAPSLFLGAIVGNIFGRVLSEPLGLTDPTSFVVVGAAAVLGASCRAPLTAIALMVEITRDTGLLVPLLSAIGMASLLTDYAEGIFSKKLEDLLLEMYVQERGHWWGAALAAEKSGEKAADTVELVMATAAKLYVRHTLPLQQAKEAMVRKRSPAAVVVDDSFSPMGVVYLDDVESEIVRRNMLLERDDNFDKE